MNFIKEIKEVFYDLIGYVLPGFITLIILFIPVSIQKFNSPIYSLILLLNNKATMINFNLKPISPNHVFLIFVLSFLLGHIINGLSHLISTSSIFKISMHNRIQLIKNNIKKDYGYLDSLNLKCLNKIRDVDFLPKELFVCDNDTECLKKNKKLLTTFATTLSRFNKCENLIQKYIYKINLYSSLSCLSFLIIMDMLVSSFYVLCNFNHIDYNLSITLSSLVFVFIFSYISFIIFYKEYYRHVKLKEKECCFFILYSYDKH